MNRCIFDQMNAQVQRKKFLGHSFRPHHHSAPKSQTSFKSSASHSTPSGAMAALSKHATLSVKLKHDDQKQFFCNQRQPQSLPPYRQTMPVTSAQKVRPDDHYLLPPAPNGYKPVLWKDSIHIKILVPGLNHSSGATERIIVPIFDRGLWKRVAKFILNCRENDNFYGRHTLLIFGPLRTGPFRDNDKVPARNS